MGVINYRFRLVGMALTLDKAFPGLFLPTSTTVGDLIVHQVELKSEKLVNKVGKLMVKDLKNVTRTWSHQVDFDIRSRITAKSISIIVSTNEPIFNFIEGGTHVRHAVMTNDFAPKTRPGQLRPQKSAGGLAYVSSGITMPGIEARHFYKATAEKHRAYFVAEMRNILRNELRLLGLRK